VRILIAEDDPISCRLLEVTLCKWGYEVAVAADGSTAWETLQQPDAPALAILDWMMPGVDGVEICRRVRERGDASYTYLILLTARGQKADLAEALGAGADDYLIKPFDPLELRARLRAGERIVDLQSRLFSALDTLRDQATRDSLTHLWNHSTIREMLRRELDCRRALRPSAAVIFADIDHFKQINDTYGHPVGDAVLREVAERMHAGIRRHDQLGRYGGEEFMVVLPGCDCARGLEVGERLRLAVAQDPIVVDRLAMRVTISLGLAAGTGETADAADLLIRAADTALYRAKNGGRNRLVAALPGVGYRVSGAGERRAADVTRDVCQLSSDTQHPTPDTLLHT
jgi:diguanylate cyclase (GGDEF)-like protein